MSNHKVRIWDHRENKPLDPKFLPLDHHLDGFLHLLLKEVVLSLCYSSDHLSFSFSFFFPCEYYLLPFFSSHSICYSDIFLSLFFPDLWTLWVFTAICLPIGTCPPLLCIIYGVYFYFYFYFVYLKLLDSISKFN